MKVIATKQGYFGKLRNVGDEFEVPGGTKGSWFAPANPVEKQKPSGDKANKTGKPDDDLV